jgi:splicing factor 3A subunit 2
LKQAIEAIMTRQILLKTPRGKTAVVSVDDLQEATSVVAVGGAASLTTTAAAVVAAAAAAVSAASDTCSSEHNNVRYLQQKILLQQLIDASKRRDIGRKRTIQDMMEQRHHHHKNQGKYRLHVGGGYDDDDDDDGDDHDDDVVCNGTCFLVSSSPSNPATNEEKSAAAEADTADDDEETFDVEMISLDEEEEERNSDHSTSSSDAEEETVVTTASRLQQNFKSLSLNQTPRLTPSTPLFTIYYQGRQLSLDTLWEWIHETDASNDDDEYDDDRMAIDNGVSTNTCCISSRSKRRQSHQTRFPLYLTLNTSVRVLGGIDRQNRVGSKFGGGGVSSGQQSERERKERLKQLALESIDLAKDPYLMRNHLGTYECKLCLTLHTNEANYLAHTQGKKHQQNLSKRAHLEKQREQRLAEQEAATGGATGLKPPPGTDALQQPPAKMLKIGRPAYQVFKSRDPDTDQRCLTFELSYPQISDGLQPRHRFVSAYEQKIELPDRRYQFLLLAAQPYETVAFKIPNEPLDQEPGRFITHWDDEDKKFTLTLYFQQPEEEDEEKVGSEVAAAAADAAAAAAATVN